MKPPSHSAISRTLREFWVKLLVAAAVIFAIGVGRGHAGEPVGTSPGHIADIDSTGLSESRDDGPYIFLQSDTTAVVEYLCGGSVIRRVYRALDTLRFPGLCTDSATEYIVPMASSIPDLQISDGVTRFLAVSDIHGDYESLVAVLQHGAVIDANKRWVWGTGHLVVVGDVFDRGDRVNECLWLIYRLEQEARHAGGHVHYVLGNHEVMALRGDYRYVNPMYRSGIVASTGVEYKKLYGSDTVLGRWLRSRHAAVRINGVLFVHGGISRSLAERGLSLTEIDEHIRRGFDQASPASGSDTLATLLIGKHGPLWYRGFLDTTGSSPAAQADVDFVLHRYDATSTVLGHTEMPRVSSLHDHRVFAIDVPVDQLGGLQALLWENHKFYRVMENGDLQVIE